MSFKILFCPPLTTYIVSCLADRYSMIFSPSLLIINRHQREESNGNVPKRKDI